MQNTISKKQQEINHRRTVINNYLIKGFTQAEISRTLNIPAYTVSKDIDWLEKEANERIKNHLDKTLPYEYNKCIQGLNQIIKEGWIIADSSTTDKKEKMQSLALVKDTYNIKMDLLTNASLLKDSIKFVELYKENKNKNDIQGSSEPDQLQQSAEIF